MQWNFCTLTQGAWQTSLRKGDLFKCFYCLLLKVNGVIFNWFISLYKKVWRSSLVIPIVWDLKNKKFLHYIFKDKLWNKVKVWPRKVISPLCRVKGWRHKNKCALPAQSLPVAAQPLMLPHAPLVPRAQRNMTDVPFLVQLVSMVWRCLPSGLRNKPGVVNPRSTVLVTLPTSHGKIELLVFPVCFTYGSSV